MLQYCDYIADKIHKLLRDDAKASTHSKVHAVGHVLSDLDPESGWLRTTTKTITVTDVHGQKYKVTVEALENDDA